MSRQDSLRTHRAIPWQCSMAIKDTLIGEGWVSPNTYCNHYSPVTDGPAVYMLHVTDKDTFGHTIVAYVGMSLRLSRRLESHNIKPLLEAAGYWVSVWFKPVGVDDLRSVERAYIERFDPPWNIACRRRGVSLNG